MRDIKRINKVLLEIRNLWEDNVPDWRLAQLFCNLQGYKGSDLYYMEDEELVELIKEYLE